MLFVKLRLERLFLKLLFQVHYLVLQRLLIRNLSSFQLVAILFGFLSNHDYENQLVFRTDDHLIVCQIFDELEKFLRVVRQIFQRLGEGVVGDPSEEHFTFVGVGDIYQ